LLSKSARYFYDAEAVRQPPADPLRTNYKPGKEAYSEGNVHGPDDRRGRRNDGFQKYAEGATCNGANLRNFWLLSPEPWRGGHFATFPSEIPRRAILAGTSERGCCAECGAPYRRVVERVGIEAPRGQLARLEARGVGRTGGGIDRDIPANYTPAISTTGWQPTCTHTSAEVIPCTVLDPFSGVGTTVLTANRLGRKGIGIELNPVWAQESRDRVVRDAPLFNLVASA
jgi:site-specific DNA-methyltransferase (adenine-specific)